MTHQLPVIQKLWSGKSILYIKYKSAAQKKNSQSLSLSKISISETHTVQNTKTCVAWKSLHVNQLIYGSYDLDGSKPSWYGCKIFTSVILLARIQLTSKTAVSSTDDIVFYSHGSYRQTINPYPPHSSLDSTMQAVKILVQTQHI